MTTANGRPRFDTGRTDGAPRVMLLHGLGGSAAIWADLVAHGGAALDFWNPDLPWLAGGDAEWSRRTEPRRWVRQAMRAVHGGPDVVVAHSFAANLVLDLLSRAEVERPKAVVLVSPFYRPAAHDFDWDTISYYLNDFHRIFEEALRVSGGDRLAEDTVGWMAQRIRDRIGPYGWMRFFEAYLATPFLNTANVTMPVLLVAGENDIAARPSDATALAAGLPDCRLAVLPGCGHFAVAERPAEFAEIVHDFLSDKDILLELTR
jgi:pimeloyl-ACP methyl ester carboxylesterase